MTSATTVTILRRVSTAASAIAPLLPGPAGMAAGVIGAGVALAADLAAAGEEPIAAIQRIRDTHPLLAQVEKRWDARMRKRFAELAGLPPDSSEDIYAELEREARQG